MFKIKRPLDKNWISNKCIGCRVIKVDVEGIRKGKERTIERTKI